MLHAPFNEPFPCALDPKARDWNLRPLITNRVKTLKMSVFSPFVGFLLGEFRTTLLLYPFFPTTVFPVVGQQVGQKILPSIKAI